MEKILAVGSQLSPSQFVTCLVTAELFWDMTMVHEPSSFKTCHFLKYIFHL